MPPADPAMLTGLAETLERRGDAIAGLNVVAGFDGFVDEMISVVGTRQSLTEFEPMPTIAELGRWVGESAGRSSLREIVVHRQDPGGCAVNFGDGIAALGVQLDVFATVGNPRHRAFDGFAGVCRSCHPLGNVFGRTLAFEFSDGKLMFSSVSQLAQIDAALVEKELVGGPYEQACGRADAIAFTDWSLYPHMTACWRVIQEKVLARLTHRPRIFVDLVDPSSRRDEDIAEMARSLAGFEAAGPTTLGVNGTEANVLSRVLGIDESPDKPAAVRDQAAALRQRLGIDEVVIHRNRFAAVGCADQAVAVDGPYCPNPRKSVGAGDRFNAGYCLGALLGLDALERLALGSATSGHFVRAAASGTAAQVVGLLRQWAQGKLPD